MSPIMSTTSYIASCDLCIRVRRAVGSEHAAVKRAEQEGWLIIRPLAICQGHLDIADPNKQCQECGSSRDLWIGNCVDCWRKAMALPRGCCQRAADADSYTTTEAMWCEPPHPRTIHARTQLSDRHGSHPGPHQCPCGAEWGTR